MSEVLTKTAVSTSNPKSALKSNDMSAQNSSASKAPQAAPTEIKAGSRVQITGAKFATGENVPSWAKANTYTVSQVNGNRALLAGINSWVTLKDLKPLSQAEIERENALAKAKEIGKASGVKGEVDDNKAKAAQYNPNESVFENAVRATWAVETGGNTRQIADIGDGAGLSVGGFQITERWALHAFVLKYQALGGKIAIPDYLVNGLKDANNGKMLSPERREELRQLLLKACDEDEACFINAQKLYWKEAFFDKCTELMTKYGLDPKTLDPKIAVLLYDHQNSGSGHNEATFKIMAKRFGDGKTIDQSKLTLENVAIAVQDQFTARNVKEYEPGWHNRVASMYAGLKASEIAGGSAPQTATQTPTDQSSTTTGQTAQAQEKAPEAPQKAPEAPTTSATIAAGSKVKIVGTNYATGQTIPNWVKSNVYSVRSISGDNALIDEIVSRVYLKDLVLVSGSAPQTPQNTDSDSNQGSTPTAPQESVPMSGGFSGLASQKRDFGTKNSNARKSKVSKITIHHMAGDMGAYNCANMHYNGNCSANYYIGSDGKICGGVREDRRAWTSSSPDNDHQAITYEVANNSGAPNWTISKAAYDAMIALSRDICSRYGITAKFDGTSGGSLTTHDMFAPTACPGPYIKGKLKDGTIERDINGGGGGDNAKTEKPKEQKETSQGNNEKQEQAPAKSTSSGSPFDALLAAHPEVKTNQHLINLFHRLSDNTYEGAAREAKKYGISMNDLVANRQGAIARPEVAPAPSTNNAPAPSTNKAPETTAPQTPLEKLLANNPGVKTHQDLINLFFRMGDNTFNGAAAVARTYGVDLNSLTYNREAPVSGATATQTPTQSNTGGTTKNNPPAVSTNGVPLFKQGDPQWKNEKLGSSSTIGKVGCAMTSTAMVLSKLKGQCVYPNELNSYLIKNGGYAGKSGNELVWDVAAGYIGKSAKRYDSYYTKAIVDSELDNGRPMVISVKSQKHWVCVAGRESDGNYIIHDPGDGKTHTGQWSDNHIAVSGYTAGARLRTFS